MIDIKVLTKQRTACLHTISARCQIQSTPMIAVTKLVQTELNTKSQRAKVEKNLEFSLLSEAEIQRS